MSQSSISLSLAVTFFWTDITQPLDRHLCNSEVAEVNILEEINRKDEGTTPGLKTGVSTWRVRRACILWLQIIWGNGVWQLGPLAVLWASDKASLAESLCSQSTYHCLGDGWEQEFSFLPRTRLPAVLWHQSSKEFCATWKTILMISIFSSLQLLCYSYKHLELYLQEINKKGN